MKWVTHQRQPFYHRMGTFYGRSTMVAGALQIFSQLLIAGSCVTAIAFLTTANTKVFAPSLQPIRNSYCKYFVVSSILSAFGVVITSCGLLAIYLGKRELAFYYFLWVFFVPSALIILTIYNTHFFGRFFHEFVRVAHNRTDIVQAEKCCGIGGWKDFDQKSPVLNTVYGLKWKEKCYRELGVLDKCFVPLSCCKDSNKLDCYEQGRTNIRARIYTEGCFTSYFGKIEKFGAILIQSTLGFAIAMFSFGAVVSIIITTRFLRKKSRRE